MRNLIRLLCCLAALAVATPAEAQSDAYRVIVNAANPTERLSEDELSRLFLKKLTTWDHGQPVVVVDQGERSPVRARFSMAVLGKDVPTMKNYWQQTLFSGRGVPPMEQTSDRQVIAFISSTPNAIGYVSSSAQLPDGIKTVSIVR